MDEKNKIIGKYSNGKNEIIRVCNGLKQKIRYINKKREDNGLKPISGPKITELILRHKAWINIEEDIINYNIKGDSN